MAMRKFKLEPVAAVNRVRCQLTFQTRSLADPLGVAALYDLRATPTALWITG